MGHLRIRDGWTVERVVPPYATARALVLSWHYSGSCSRTATEVFYLLDPEGVIAGVAWFLPPMPASAKVVYPANPARVTSLSRLVVRPGVPTNGASFLMGRALRTLRTEGRWKRVVTYADEGQGHTGAIYRATNWIEDGHTSVTTNWADANGNGVAKRSTVNRSVAEMKALGYTRNQSTKRRFLFPLE